MQKSQLSILASLAFGYLLITSRCVDYVPWHARPLLNHVMLTLAHNDVILIEVHKDDISNLLLPAHLLARSCGGVLARPRQKHFSDGWFLCSEFCGFPVSADDPDVSRTAAQQTHPPHLHPARPCKDQEHGLLCAEVLRGQAVHIGRLPSFGNRSVQINTNNMPLVLLLLSCGDIMELLKS